METGITLLKYGIYQNEKEIQGKSEEKTSRKIEGQTLRMGKS